MTAAPRRRVRRVRGSSDPPLEARAFALAGGRFDLAAADRLMGGPS